MNKLKSKLKATAIHFAISLVVFIVLVLIIRYVWFPGILFHIDGGWQGIRIIAAVDLVLGPLLTFIVYKKAKKGLMFDFSLIAIAQIVALSYGLFTVYMSRPVALVYSQGRIYSAAYEMYQKEEVPMSEIAKFPGNFPKKIYLNLPEDPKDRVSVVKQSKSKVGLTILDTNLYKPLAENLEKLKSAKHEALKNPQQQAEFNLALKSIGREENEILLVPFNGRFKTSYIFLERSSGNIIGETGIIAPAF